LGYVQIVKQNEHDPTFEEERKMNYKTLKLLALFTLGVGLLVSCAVQETGSLGFYANGEDFVRQGFVSKDGWSINFDHVFVTLEEISAYQTDPPYDPHDNEAIDAKNTVALDGTYPVDLAEGGMDADPILVGEVTDAPTGQYNAISWEMVGGDSGYPLVIVGSAEKSGEVIDFVIQVETEYSYTCGEYVGDERKGILQKDGIADLEMTFHFDHIFGDAETPMDDALNLGAPGFDPFAGVAESGKLEIDLAGLQNKLSSEDYQMLVDILPTLGHVGEGHCHCETQ
jgi:hypothetical protein